MSTSGLTLRELPRYLWARTVEQGQCCQNVRIDDHWHCRNCDRRIAGRVDIEYHVEKIISWDPDSRVLVIKYSCPAARTSIPNLRGDSTFSSAVRNIIYDAGAVRVRNIYTVAAGDFNMLTTLPSYFRWVGLNETR